MRTQIGCLALCLSLSVDLAAQDIAIDWATGKHSIPAQIDRTQTVSIAVRSLNDVLYEYTVEARTSPRPVDDLGTLLAGVNLERPEAGPAGCADTIASLYQDLKTKWDAEPAFHPAYDKDLRLYNHVPLSDTLDALSRYQQANGESITRLRFALPATNCSSPDDRALIQSVGNWLNALDAFTRRALGSHERGLTKTLNPDEDLTVSVTETLRGGGTKDGSKEFTCSPASGALSFSGGVLVSTVPSRIYSTRRSPVTLGATETQEILAVDNASTVSPASVALFNYNLPWLPRKTNWAGIALSLGPVYRLGSQQEASNAGFFAGLSIGIWRRLYLTPGYHLGQFDDIPVGFAPGLPIPPGFGDLTPTKRWTVRFAIGLSFKAADFNKAASGARTIPLTPPPASPPKTPASATPEPATPPTEARSRNDTSAGSPGARARQGSEGAPEAAPVPAASIEPVFRIGTLQLSGSGCPPSTFSSASTPDALAVTVLFEQFRASSPRQQTRATASCRILLPLQAPEGYRVSPRTADYRGAADIVPVGSWSYAAAAGVAAVGRTTMGGSFRHVESGARHETFVAGRATPPYVWSGCGGQIALVFEFEIAARGGGSQSSTVQIDSFDFSARQSQHIVWEHCGSR